MAVAVFYGLLVLGFGGMIGAWFVPGGPLRVLVFCAGVAALTVIAAQIS
jgi:hypothetical protein